MKLFLAHRILYTKNRWNTLTNKNLFETGLTPIILDIWEADMGMTMVLGQPM
jgi:hypothetical protein